MSLKNSIFLKYGTLFLITFQTTSMVLLLRYSRKSSDPNEVYFNSTAVFLSEYIKVIICLVTIICTGSLFGLYNEIVSRSNYKILIPAFFYTIQNNLLYLALTNLDAATYQITYQLKILTTAFFSKIILKKYLSTGQWLSLCLLMIGVIMVQWPDDSSQLKISTSENRMIGLIAVFLSSLSSGYAGVYFEKLLKQMKSQSLWTLNLQLALVSCLFALATILINDYSNVQKKGFFYGYDTITWIVIFLQAFGGICVSLVMKYADNILKGFATTISIIFSSICSYYILNDFSPNTYFYVGTLLVISSTICYMI